MNRAASSKWLWAGTVVESKIIEIFTGKRVRARKLLGKGQKRLKSMHDDQIKSFARNWCTC